MNEISQDMWEFAKTFDSRFPLIFITTNGFVKKNGKAVMGRGCAQEARDMFPGVDTLLGDSLKSKGNSVAYIGTWDIDGFTYHLFSFPVKHNWWEDADLDLIEKSCAYLQKLIELKLPIETIILPRPGCGNGKLDWETQVKPLMLSYLDFDNVYICHK